jgi:hypothetical protein
VKQVQNLSRSELTCYNSELIVASICVFHSVDSGEECSIKIRVQELTQMSRNVGCEAVRLTTGEYPARTLAGYCLAACLLLLLDLTPAWGQANNLFAPVPQRLQPARASRLPQLNDLTMVKLTNHEGQLQLVMMLESYRSEKRTGPVTTFRQEQRTRMVEVDGKKVEQTYTVNVPVSIEGEVEVRIPAGRKPVSKPVGQFRFVDLKGQAVSAESASEILQTLQPAFLLDRFAGELPEIPEIYQNAIQKNCLIIITEETVIESPNIVRAQALPAQRFELPAVQREK